jgi:EmrB/QacA subfamily drug resistance transporter
MVAQKQSRNGFVVAGLLLGILIAAMDNTIVATATGTIVSDLGGFDKFVWVTSAYLITQVAGTPIFGKLSDMYGRKKFFLFGLIVFLTGSILCGMAQNMVQLSIYRAIQGIGAGALNPIAFTIMFDLFPPEKRGKMSGLFGATFGLSSIFGPLFGALITDNFSWHWIFYINVPLGIISLALIVPFYKESKTHTKAQIDWWGALTLVISVVSLMFALELGGNEYAWDSVEILGLFVSFAVFLLVFIWIEMRAKEPIINFQMFRKRLFTSSVLANLFYGIAFIVGTVYIPIFVQGVMGGSTTNAGFILIPMTLGSVVGAQIGGLLVSKTSFRTIMVTSCVIFIMGVFLLSTISPDITNSVLTTYMIITGFGVGFSFSVLGQSAIQPFGYRERGSATSTSTFLRTLGMTLGITIFGILQRNYFTDKITSVFSGVGGANLPAGQLADPRALLNPETREKIPPVILEKITAVLSDSIAYTFAWAIIPAVFAFICVSLMGNERVEVSKKKADPVPN